MLRAFGLAVCIALSTTSIQADLIEFRLTGNGGNGLLADNVTPGTTSLGEGGIGLTGIIFDTEENILHVDVSWGTGNGFSGDLTGSITNLHLHGPTDDPPPNSYSQTGPLIVNLANSLNFNDSASNGGVVDDYFIGNPDVPGLLEGRTYINVHTDMYEFGEIRGYLVPINIPEPGSALVISVAGLAVFFRRLR